MTAHRALAPQPRQYGSNVRNSSATPPPEAAEFDRPHAPVRQQRARPHRAPVQVARSRPRAGRAEGVPSALYRPAPRQSLTWASWRWPQCALRPRPYAHAPAPPSAANTAVRIGSDYGWPGPPRGRSVGCHAPIRSPSAGRGSARDRRLASVPGRAARVQGAQAGAVSLPGLPVAAASSLAGVGVRGGDAPASRERTAAALLGVRGCAPMTSGASDDASRPPRRHAGHRPAARAGAGQVARPTRPGHGRGAGARKRGRAGDAATIRADRPERDPRRALRRGSSAASARRARTAPVRDPP